LCLRGKWVSPELLRKEEGGVYKLNSFRENFKRKEKEIRADLEEARRIWREVSETFKWWQSLPYRIRKTKTLIRREEK